MADYTGKRSRASASSSSAPPRKMQRTSQTSRSVNAAFDVKDKPRTNASKPNSNYAAFRSPNSGSVASTGKSFASSGSTRSATSNGGSQTPSLMSDRGSWSNDNYTDIDDFMAEVDAAAAASRTTTNDWASDQRGSPAPGHFRPGRDVSMVRQRVEGAAGGFNGIRDDHHQYAIKMWMANGENNRLDAIRCGGPSRSRAPY